MPTKKQPPKRNSHCKKYFLEELKPGKHRFVAAKEANNAAVRSAVSLARKTFGWNIFTRTETKGGVKGTVIYRNS